MNREIINQVVTDEDYLVRIERSAFRETETQALFDFREVFLRYGGIAHNSKEQPNIDGFRAFYAISGHPDPITASKCRNRTNHNKIAKHLITARNEFIESVHNICALVADPAIIAETAAEFADRCDSKIGSDEVRSALSSFIATKDKPLTDVSISTPAKACVGLREAA